MRKSIVCLLALTSFYIPIFSQVQQGQDLFGKPGDRLGVAVSVSANGQRIATGANLNSANGQYSGYALVFDLLGDSLVQVGDTIKGESGDNCGTSIVLSATGSRVAIGSQRAKLGAIRPGSVRIFDWTDNQWVQVGTTLYGQDDGGDFGEVIDISSNGKRIIVGARGDFLEGGSGSVSVYEESAGEWQQLGQIIRGGPSENIGLAVSISEDGKRIAFGQNETDDNNPGFIRVYELVNDTWHQVGPDVKGKDPGESVGTSVALSADGKQVVLGGPRNDVALGSPGRVYVYQEIGGNWEQLGNDIDGQGSLGWFGLDVSMSGNGERIAVGSPFGGKGRIFVFELTNNSWIQLGETIGDKVTNDYFSDAMDMSPDGKWIVGGGWFNNIPGTNAGLTQLYSIPRIVGSIYHDLDMNCTRDIVDVALPERYAMIEPGSILVKSDKRGSYSLDTLPPGQYTITFDTTGPWRPSCPVVQHFVIPDTGTILQAPSMAFTSAFECTQPQISVVMPSITRCFDNQIIYVNVCNNNYATATLMDPYIILRLNENITPLSASVPFEYISNFQYQFHLDSLTPGECDGFHIKANISCNTILGQTLCIESALFPSDTCQDIYTGLYNPSVGISCAQPYDGSDLSVDVKCDGDSLQFIIENNAFMGEGDMECFSQIRIYRDEFLVAIDSLRLMGGEHKEFTKYADGYTWRIEADQHPKFPGWSRPSASIELCGDPENWTAGLINYFNLDDLDPAFDIFCDQVTGSYDPNDKSAHPGGTGSENTILPNQQIEYLIRFQNTGTDTAHNIVIRDTLDKSLNMASIVEGPSSHGHVFHIASPGILEWYFSNILLPDSNINESASHGFVSYSIRQQPDLEEGVLIQNRAAIYFDYNDAIITNSTNHKIRRPTLLTSLPDPFVTQQLLNYKIYPNPGNGKYTIDFDLSIDQVDVEISDLHGKLIYSKKENNVQRIMILLDELPGVYILKINTGSRLPSICKLILAD